MARPSDTGLTTILRGGSPRRGVADWVLGEEHLLLQEIREGRFQRVLAVVTAMAAALSGGEVAYEHYRGSYGQQVMYSPVILSVLLFLTGLAATVSRRMAKTALPFISLLVILDGIVGFVFHIRGIARRPGGWRIPIANLVMGPPVFAPLLFGLSGYLGLVTSFLRRPHERQGAEPGSPSVTGRRPMRPLRAVVGEGRVLEHRLREGRFQRNVAAVAGISALFSGVEAMYSHYQNNFQYRKLQWSPILVAPALTVAGLGSVGSRKMAHLVLPWVSLIAVVNGLVGTFFHVRGVFRKPGGLKLPLFNVIYGPPIFAPLLLSASGFMGVLASLLRRPA